MITIEYTSLKEERLDSYLQGKYPSLTFGIVNKFFRERKIKVNGKKVPLSTHLKQGDSINLYIKDEFLKQISDKLDIVYEDKHVLIVNKPAGLITIDEDDKKTDSLINRAKNYLKSQKDSASKKNELCHRLDTGTSGLVIISKDEETLNDITQLIKRHLIFKEYKCLTYGIPKDKMGTIKNYLLKDTDKKIVKQYETQVKGSKEAITHYEVEKTNGNIALINIELETGRTHQIRVHMAGINCPILGDSKYGDNDINRDYHIKRQALCAYKLVFPKECSVDALKDRTITIDLPDIFSDFYAGNLK